MTIKISAQHPNPNIANAVGSMAERGNKFSLVWIGNNQWKVKNQFIIPLTVKKK